MTLHRSNPLIPFCHHHVAPTSLSLWTPHSISSVVQAVNTAVLTALYGIDSFFQRLSNCIQNLYKTLPQVLETTSAVIMATMPRCDSPQPLQWTSFARFPSRRPLRSPSPSPLDASEDSEASSTLSDSPILITPESSLLLDKDNVGVYNYIPSTESKPSPSLLCDFPELLPHQISVALKDELPFRSSHALDSAEVDLGKFNLTVQVDGGPLTNFGSTAGACSGKFSVDSLAQPNPAVGTLPSFAHAQNGKELGMRDEETSPSSSDVYFPVLNEKSGFGAQPRMMGTSTMLDRFLTNPVCDLSDEVETTEQFSVAHGGFADIYKGVWARPFCGETGKTVVCIYFKSTKWGSELIMMAVVTGGNKIASSVYETGGGPCTSTKGGLLHYPYHPLGS